MEVSNTISLAFDKSEMKDLIIHQMATFMKQNWSDDEVIDLFHNPQFKFFNQDEKYRVTAELMKEQKEAVQREIALMKAQYSNV